jgi:hypothetical protein
MNQAIPFHPIMNAIHVSFSVADVLRPEARSIDAAAQGALRGVDFRPAVYALF